MGSPIGNKKAVELSLQKVIELIIIGVVILVIILVVGKFSQDSPNVILTPSQALAIEKCESAGRCNIEKCTEEMVDSEECEENEFKRWEMWEKYFKQCDNPDIDEEKKENLGCDGKLHDEFKRLIGDEDDEESGGEGEGDEVQQRGIIGGMTDWFKRVFGRDNCPNKGRNDYECKCENCQDLRDNSIVECKRSNTNCGITPELKQKLEELVTKMKNQKNVELRVTEGWPPSVAHYNQCHYIGTCVDMNFKSFRKATPENIRAFIDLAKEEGLKAEYEVQNPRSREALIKQGRERNIQFITGGSNAEIKYVPGVSPHFSVYMN